MKTMSLKEGDYDIGLPSYEDVVSEGRSSSNNHAQPTVQDEVHLELWRLATSIQYNQGQRMIQTEAQDKGALELLIPEIKDFLDEFSKTTFRRATLIIIPSGEIDEDAALCDNDLQTADEYCQIVKTDGGKGAIDFLTWNETAKRLARYLQPRAENSSVKRPKPQAEAANPITTTKFWSKKSSGGKIAAITQLDDDTGSLPTVVMDVKVEEVTFRTQTLLGLYETQSICGLVIRIRVNAKRLEDRMPSCSSSYYR